MLKRIENGIQDRTSDTRQLYKVLDTEQGGKGFKTIDKFLTVEVLFKTKKLKNGRVEPSFKEWEKLQQLLNKEKYLNIVTYGRIREKYKHLLEVIKTNNIEIHYTHPLNLHWTRALLRPLEKGCRHIRKLPDLDYSKWQHLINGSEFLQELMTTFLPSEAAKVISSVYQSSTVPLAGDMQISILRNKE